MKSVVVKFLGLAGAAVLLAACDRAAEVDEVFEVAVSAPFTSLDPVRTVDANTLQLHLNTYSLLFRQRRNGEVEPSLAVSADSPDRKRWEIVLRRGVHFCGVAGDREVNADDVVATLTRAALSPNSRVSWVFREVEKAGGKPRIEKLAADRLAVYFREPVDLPRYLTLPQLGVLPAEVIDRKLSPTESSMGSGPYRISRYGPDGVELTACAGGFPKAKIDKVRIRIVRDRQVAMGMIKSGQVDAMELDFSQWRQVTTEKGAPKDTRLVYNANPADFRYILFNTRDPRLRDPAARRALNHALDRSKLCRGPLLNFCRPVNFVSAMEGVEGGNDLYQPEKAKQEWQALASPPREITLLTFSNEVDRTVAQWVAREWKKTLGLEVKVKVMDFGPLLGTLFGGKEFTAATLWVQPLSDLPEIWFLAWQPGDMPPRGRNISRLDDPRFTALFNELRQRGRVQGWLSQKVEAVLEQDPPAAPLYQLTWAWLVNKDYELPVGRIKTLELWEVTPR